jgi:hypothetical protein
MQCIKNDLTICTKHHELLKMLNLNRFPSADHNGLLLQKENLSLLPLKDRILNEEKCVIN